MALLDLIKGKKLRSPTEAVEAACDVLGRLYKESLNDRISEDLYKAFKHLKILLFGDEKHEASREQAVQASMVAIESFQHP